jgi:uncharacterized protein (AIM24 family)
MAHLQFGQSKIQISGQYVPVADVNLGGPNMVYFSHHVLLWKDPSVKIQGTSLAGAWKRMLAGLPLILTEARGPGHVAVSMDNPGETVAIPLDPGKAIDVREGMFLLATEEIDYAWTPSPTWYRTERAKVFPAGRFLDRFTCRPGPPGLLLLHAAGNVFVRDLAFNEEILVKPTCLLYKEPTVQMLLYIEHPRNYNMVWSRRYLWLRMCGPGRVAIHSAFHQWEDPHEPVRFSSPGTLVYDWY